jgi:hypothetical protein
VLATIPTGEVVGIVLSSAVLAACISGACTLLLTRLTLAHTVDRPSSFDGSDSFEREVGDAALGESPADGTGSFDNLLTEGLGGPCQ